MRDIVFSIIMPCYNSQDYVKKAIESVVNQTYENLELVLINDGSYDDTLKIAESYAQKDERIKIFSKENGGYVSAVNMGLDKITGDYFCFIGSDDAFDLGLFEQIYKKMFDLDFEPDCVTFRTVRVFDNGNREPDEFTDFDTCAYLKNATIKQYEHKYPDHARILSNRDTSKLFKTSLLKDLRYFGKYGIAADGIFSMLFCHRAASFLSVPYDGYLWNLRGDSVSSQISTDKNIDQLINWSRFYDELQRIDANEITDIERGYSISGLVVAKNLCSDIGTACKYCRFIKDNAKRSLSMAAALSPASISFGMRIVAASPILYAMLCKLRKF